MNAPRQILLIRRDNIGDLVLTTPLIHALRGRFADCWIGVLGNSYNTPALAGHPDIDAVFAYDKAKHRPERHRIGVYAETAQLLWRLRALRIDLAILAGPGAQHQSARLARWVRPRDVLGFSAADGDSAGLTIPVPYGSGAVLHEAEDVFRLGAPLGIDGPAGPCRVVADARASARVADALIAAGISGRPVVAIHLSARRAPQRWPAGRFAALMRALHQRHGAAFVLLWAPGPADDPRHPGDDAKADEVQRDLTGAVPLLAWPTVDLASLLGALACCDLMVCADGGAMHLAAGLGKPVVALFGDSPARRWHPWGVRHAVVQATSGDVADLSVDEVAAACVAVGVRRSA